MGIETIGVLGAGVMGGFIAQVTATGGYRTVCYDIDPDALLAGREHATTGRFGLDRGVERGKLTKAEADAALARLEFGNSFDAAAACDPGGRGPKGRERGHRDPRRGGSHHDGLLPLAVRALRDGRGCGERLVLTTSGAAPGSRS